MLGGNMFEDQRRLVVRLEVPGMEKDEFDIEVLDDARGKRGEALRARAHEGRYRMFQCAYGGFRRVVPLPVPVLADACKASYKTGVLKIELTKAKPAKPNVQTMKGKTTRLRTRYPTLHYQVKTTSALLCATILRRQR